MTYEEKLNLIAREAEIHALITERDSMHAANYARREQGHSDAYGEDAFMAIAERLREVQSVQWGQR